MSSQVGGSDRHILRSCQHYMLGKRVVCALYVVHFANSGQRMVMLGCSALESKTYVMKTPCKCRGVCETGICGRGSEVAGLPVKQSTGTEVGRGSRLRVHSPACRKRRTDSEGKPTGVDGSRTHQGRLCGTPQTVLKTAEPTGTQPPPRTAVAYPLLPDWSREE